MGAFALFAPLASVRGLLSPTVAVPLAVITIIQTVLTMGAYSLPVVIPVAASEFGIDPDVVGYLVSTVYLTGMMMGLTAGPLIARFGPTRVFQFLLVVVALGALTLIGGSVIAAFAAAVLIGCATGPMNPAGSFVLARVAQPDIRALVFSLKQCGTPAGGMLAGALLPPLMIAYDWRVAVLSMPVFAALMIFAAPFGRLGGRPDPLSATSRIGVLGAVRVILTEPALRALTLCAFGLAVCQTALVAYLIVFLLHSAGYSAETAGLAFAVTHLAGISSRIALGLIADRLLSTRWVLVIVGLVMGVALALISTISDAWSIAWVYVVMVAAGASGNGWVGLYFAELARLSPPDLVTETAAGSQFVSYLGIVCGPLLFAIALNVTDSYAQSFQLIAAASVACGLYLAVAGR